MLLDFLHDSLSFGCGPNELLIILRFLFLLLLLHLSVTILGSCRIFTFFLLFTGSSSIPAAKLGLIFLYSVFSLKLAALEQRLL